jgi:hypothetical protein
VIRFRFTIGDPASRRYFEAERDGETIVIGSVQVKMRTPSGLVRTGNGVIEDASLGQFYVDFGTGGLDLDEPGDNEVEIIVNGEHNQEPISIWVRPEFVRGPR